MLLSPTVCILVCSSKLHGRMLQMYSICARGVRFSSEGAEQRIQVAVSHKRFGRQIREQTCLLNFIALFETKKQIFDPLCVAVCRRSVFRSLCDRTRHHTSPVGTPTVGVRMTPSVSRSKTAATFRRITQNATAASTEVEDFAVG